MPRLDAFDEEFERQPVAVLRGHRRRSKLWFWVFFCLLVGAGVGAFAMAWPDAVATLHPELQAFVPQSASREANEQINRLAREVEDLRQEIQELTNAQRQAAETIAALKGVERELQDRRFAFWFSDPAALHHGIVSLTEPSGTVAPLRGAVTARPRTGEARRTPMSLEPQQ